MLHFVEKTNRVANQYCEEFGKLGFIVSHSTDFFELERLTAQFETPVTPHFSTAHNTFFRDYAFWVGLWRDGHCVATVAYCRQPLGSETLAGFVSRYWKRTYREGSDNEIILQPNQKRILEKITGNLIYSGEIEVDPSLRGQGIGGKLAHYGRLMAFMMWPDTDCFYIFTENSSAKRGLLAITGMSFQIANALNWMQHPSQARTDYWLAGVWRADFLDWLDDSANSSYPTALRG